VKFYRGDPSNNVNEEGTKHSGTCGAGPLEPGKRWNSSTRNFHLPDGQYEFNVILDCDSNISEIDEDNNRAVLYVKIENGQIADKSVKCPAPAMPADSDESKVPAEMVGTWFFDNPHGDDEQMAVFPDGRVVALYSNGHKDQTNIVDGFIELAEFDNARCRMTIGQDGSLVQYFGSDLSGSGKRWNRIAPEPHTNLLRPLTGP